MSSAADPPFRPLTRKGQETRRRIIDTAADLIFDRGVAGTTIDDVRTAADVSSSQLYHYFDDKPALVRAVIERQTEAIVTNQARFDLSTIDGLRAWRDWVVAYQHSIGCRGGCPIGSLGSELVKTEPRARDEVADGFRRWEAEIDRGLGQMRTDGRLPADTDTGQLALALLTALQGGLLLTQIERDTKPLEAALDAMIELISQLSQSA